MTGRCFCGNVVFEFDGPITDIEICHYISRTLVVANADESRVTKTCLRRPFEEFDRRYQSRRSNTQNGSTEPPPAFEVCGGP